jgi:hypothetical protein
MSKQRASLFEEAPALDVGSFAPKTSVDARAPAAEQVRTVSEAAQFRSREGATTKPDRPAKREHRRYRTGRNVQFNVKALKVTVDTFYALAEEQNWVLGYTLERAVEALRRELESKP